MQLPLSFHLTAMIVALVCWVSAALVASTAFMPVSRSLGSAVGGICSTRRAGWWRCHGLLGGEGGCVGFGDFCLGLMVGPEAKTSLGLVGWGWGGGLRGGV